MVIQKNMVKRLPVFDANATQDRQSSNIVFFICFSFTQILWSIFSFLVTLIAKILPAVRIIIHFKTLWMIWDIPPNFPLRTFDLNWIYFPIAKVFHINTHFFCHFHKLNSLPHSCLFYQLMQRQQSISVTAQLCWMVLLGLMLLSFHHDENMNYGSAFPISPFLYHAATSIWIKSSLSSSQVSLANANQTFIVDVSENESSFHGFYGNQTIQIVL